MHDRAIALAGLELGNVLVALQPPRGYGMDPDAIYHRPDLPPPHNYYTFYGWLHDGWRADAIVHFGKHGTLVAPAREWGSRPNVFRTAFSRTCRFVIRCSSTIPARARPSTRLTPW